MTYNLCYFLGNKAFVIDFLETGLLCCVYLRPTRKELSGENIFPSPEFGRAFYSSLSGVLLLSVNTNSSGKTSNAIFAGRITWNPAYSPFNVILTC